MTHVLYKRRDHRVFMKVYMFHGLCVISKKRTVSIWFMVSCVIQYKRPQGVMTVYGVHGLMSFIKEVTIECLLVSCLISLERPLRVYESMGFMVSLLLSKKRPLRVYDSLGGGGSHVLYHRRDLWVFISLWGSWSHMFYNRRDHLVFNTDYKVHGLMCYTN